MSDAMFFVRSRVHYACPFCMAVSHHPADIEKRYCGKCKTFAEDIVTGLTIGVNTPSRLPAASVSPIKECLMRALQAIHTADKLLNEDRPSPWARVP